MANHEPETMARYEDERGVLTVVCDGPTINFIEVVTFAEPGVVRGNHYHADYFEHAYVQSGSVEVTLRCAADSAERVVQVEAGELLRIEPETVHTFVAKEQSVVICFGSGASPSIDRHRVTQ